MTEQRRIRGAVEAGGTKFNCAVATDDGEWLRELRLPTTTPAETLGGMLEFFSAARVELGEIGSFGVASFGPLELDPAAPGWGSLLRTPKLGSDGVNLVAPLRERFGRPIAIDTDVIAAALA